MEKEQFSKLLYEQQEKGKDLLSLISTMHESQNDFGDGMVLFGGEDLYYVPENELDDFLNKFEGWKSYVYELLEAQFGSDCKYVYEWNTYVTTHVSKREPILKQLTRNVNKALSLIESFLERINIYKRIGTKYTAQLKEEVAKKKCVFIVHGHNEEMKQSVARVVGQMGLNPIILHEQPNGGKTIIEKFESNADSINFAIILLSGDDLAASVCDLNGVENEELRQRLEKRARQNVVFEMGYFVGKLGRNNVFFLLQDGVTKPGDLDGIVYTAYDAAHAWRFELVKELKTCGYDVDANKIL